MKKVSFILLIFINSCVVSKNPEKLIETDNPLCINLLIKKFQEEAKQSSLRSIYSYRYGNQMVYYVPSLCCDQFSDLYDSNCVLIGHPDGGVTGIGDGLVMDFNEVKTHEKLIWRDNR